MKITIIFNKWTLFTCPGNIQRDIESLGNIQRKVQNSESKVDHWSRSALYTRFVDWIPARCRISVLQAALGYNWYVSVAIAHICERILARDKPSLYNEVMYPKFSCVASLTSYQKVAHSLSFFVILEHQSTLTPLCRSHHFVVVVEWCLCREPPAFPNTSLCPVVCFAVFFVFFTLPSKKKIGMPYARKIFFSKLYQPSTYKWILTSGAKRTYKRLHTPLYYGTYQKCTCCKVFFGWYRLWPFAWLLGRVCA